MLWVDVLTCPRKSVPLIDSGKGSHRSDGSAWVSARNSWSLAVASAGSPTPAFCAGRPVSGGIDVGEVSTTMSRAKNKTNTQNNRSLDGGWAWEHWTGETQLDGSVGRARVAADTRTVAVALHCDGGGGRAGGRGGGRGGWGGWDGVVVVAVVRWWSGGGQGGGQGGSRGERRPDH